MSTLILKVQAMAHDMGDDFGFEDETIDYLATEFQLSKDEVREILSENDAYMDDDSYEEFNDNMDGDFDSAMASAGFGTDEDYGYASDDY